MARTKERTTSFEDLERTFHQRKFAPLYLFCGEEDFLIDEALDILIAEAIDESTRGFNLDILYGSDVTPIGLMQIASSFPMAAERRIAIVREFDKMSNKDLLLRYITKPSPTTSLVLVSAKPDFRTKFFKTIRENAIVAEFSQLYDNNIPPWIARRITKLGKQVTPEACQLIQNYVGKSLREIQNEIDKLFIYVGEKKLIDSDDVNSVVGMSRQYNIFELQKAIGRRDVARVIEISENMLRNGESPVGTIVMLTRYFQKVWLIQELLSMETPEAQIATAIGVNPYFVKEYAAAGKSFSSPQILDCFSALANADEHLKSSSLDQKTVMTVLMCRLSQPTQHISENCLLPV